MPASNGRERPMTPEERALLEARLKDLGGGGSLLLTAAMVFLILLLAGFGLTALFDLPRLGGRSAAGIAAGLVAARTYLRMRGSLTRSPYADHLRQDLANGVASESTYDVTDAILVEEFEDEGPSFYLKLAGGRVLFLSGQYLEDRASAQKFPSTRFVLVRVPKSGTLLDFRCEGAYVPPSTVLEPFTIEQMKSDDAPSDGDVLEADFEKLRHSQS